MEMATGRVPNGILCISQMLIRFIYNIRKKTHQDPMNDDISLEDTN